MHPTWHRFRRLAIGLALAAVLLGNLLAWHHAGCFLTYVEAGERTAPPEQLRGLGKLGVLLTGVRMSRPGTQGDRAKLDPPARVERRPAGDGEIEIWWFDLAEPHGTVLVLPGYAEAKSDLWPDARAWLDLGYAVGLLDFRGAGGSSGRTITFGWREAEDVQAAAQSWNTAGRPGGRLLLYGHSMGGAAALRAVADLGVPADGVIIVSTFDRMRNAVRERFRALGVPAWPAGDLLVFWAGVRNGFNGFQMNPADFAARTATPLLILHGNTDRRAPPGQARAIAARARGPVLTEIFPGAGHESLVSRDPARWRKAVEGWLPSLDRTPASR